VTAPDDAPKRTRQSDKTKTNERTRPPEHATPTEPVGAPTPSAPDTDRAPDLIEARRRAAAEVLTEREHANSYRSFAFPGTIAEQRAFDDQARFHRTERGLQAPLTVFDSPSKGRAGMTASTALDSQRWVSDDCYQLVDTTGRLWLPGFWVPATLCVRRQPRADLFEAAKPSYLVNKEEGEAADAEAQRRERLRRPTTGAVMALSED
jgi:hypothetical protein